MNPSDTEYLAYVTCPACRRGIPHPFARTSQPQSYVHYNRHGPDCRLIVVAHPGRTKPSVQQVADGVSLEQALTAMLEKAA